MNIDFIPLSVPNIGSKEEEYVADALRGGWVATGSYIGRFETEFAAYAKVESAVAVQSGTAGLHLAMTDCGICEGDIVITPTLTFIATVNPIRYVGAEPVFMDCDDSLCIDPVKLEHYLEKECEMRDGVSYDKKINKPVKAIVVVHIFGNGADMEKIMKISRRFNIPVIEDATEAVGTFYTSGDYAGRMAGAIGDYGVYSFNGNKIISTGGGGMVVANRKDSINHIRHLSRQAKADEVYFIHDEIGYNYRMTNIQAAIGVAQLERLEEFIDTKKRNYNYYQKLGVTLLPFNDNIRPNYWFYSYLSDDRDSLIKHLGENLVQARPIWKLMHTLDMYKQYREYKITKAIEYHEKIVNLPCSSNLTPEDAERVAELINS
ncbi:MAG: LegC family aminotransferase [Clostridiales bacterium]|nr:LegC family aminotransferase [Clostridiales bacterium]